MNDYLEKLWDNHSAQVLEVGYNGLLIIAVIFASHFGAKFLHRWINRTNDRFERFDETLVPILCTVASVVVYAVGLVIILDFFGVNTTSILALLGAAGLAIALALKDTLSNIAAGMMLLILRPFRRWGFDRIRFHTRKSKRSGIVYYHSGNARWPLHFFTEQ